MTNTAVAYIITVVVLFVFISSLASALLLLKKIRWRFWKRKKGPTSAELRQRRIPVIESTPFWVPGIPSSLVGIEIQPSAQLLPVTYSTPKPRRHKLVRTSREKRPLFLFLERRVQCSTTPAKISLLRFPSHPWGDTRQSQYTSTGEIPTVLFS